MSIVDEFLVTRTDLLESSKGPDKFIDEQSVLSEVLPLMLDAKLVDSEDFNDCYFSSEEDDLKLNGYAVNETQERLQLFVVDEHFVNEKCEPDELLVSERAYYESQFKRATRLVRSAIDGTLVKKLQDADPLKALVVQLASEQGIDQFDVIEVFLITLSGTVSRRGQELQPRDIHFERDASLKVSQKTREGTRRKDILLLRRVIDLNFIHAVNVSRGHREPLVVDFTRDFGTQIEVIHAADEEHFESYLCVLSADILADLYRLYSSRLLEKNVRSFLQFKGVNRGIRDTIRESPGKFIAYNNGLTITATKARVVQHKRKTYLESLTDFQIVNGGQTTASIYFSRKDGLDVSRVRVMAKINVVKGESEAALDDLISNISRFSNTQSRVSGADLRSRNPQLQKLKSLSDSVTTPSGNKWFFERARGEFQTTLRLAGGQKATQQRKYPPARRFSKEELAKYYTAWGDTPHLVKKGGEKVFRHFIEEISPSSEGGAGITVDRVFYEELVAKIILFRQMEKLYGQGKNAIGQIRSAAIPYSLACLHAIADGSQDDRRFDLQRIWLSEGLENDLATYLHSLLTLMNDLIKKYAQSDDYGEYAKRPELWQVIRKSPEVREFSQSADTRMILEKYSVAQTVTT